MLKTTLTALALVAAGTSLAGARPNTLTMSCDEAIALVQRAGAIVLSTGRYTYDRFVADNSFCIPGQDVRRAMAPTEDTRYCTIGYTCVERDRLYRNDN
jgi:hypothetical protein